MEVTGELHAPATLPLGKESLSAHWKGGWIGLRAVLDAAAVEKRNIAYLPRESYGDSSVAQTISYSSSRFLLSCTGLATGIVQ
jgi:hypothetical protein